MEREIKFRAWHVGNKQMIYPYARSFNDILSSGDLLNRFDSEFLMQFTGLKDKNGKEIYGGDIIETVTGGNMVINWNNLKASFVIDREGWAFQHFFGEALEADECEVIGNIYENPKLLNT